MTKTNPVKLKLNIAEENNSDWCITVPQNDRRAWTRYTVNPLFSDHPYVGFVSRQVRLRLFHSPLVESRGEARTIARHFLDQLLNRLPHALAT